jgi:hypothetical protein
MKTPNGKKQTMSHLCIVAAQYHGSAAKQTRAFSSGFRWSAVTIAAATGRPIRKRPDPPSTLNV